MTVSAKLVMELRERTGSGMMECKKFLIEANGDIDLAIKKMREAGQAKADKKADRIAAEGLMAIARSTDNRTAVMVEVNCETDFVTKNDDFIDFANKVAETALHAKTNEVDSLANETLAGTDSSVEQIRQMLVAKIGENIRIRRMIRVACDGIVGYYLHGNRIGVIAALKGGDDTLAKDIAMHVAASRPLVVSREQIPTEAIENERDIFKAQARESGKPQEIIDKMIEGRINKFMEEVSLIDQPFVKNPDTKVGQLVKSKNAEVLSFVRFEVGEGIEKKQDNFVEEVMAQVRN